MTKIFSPRRTQRKRKQTAKTQRTQRLKKSFFAPSAPLRLKINLFLLRDLRVLRGKLKNLLILLILFFVVGFATAAPILLENAPIDTHNKASILRGAQFFTKTCMMCHSLKYLTHDPIAKKAGIDYSKMPIQSQEWWAGTPPPDLTLEAAARGSDWIYTYLHSFYQDNSRPTGNNNLLVDNTNMPNPFVGMQGIQILVVDKKELMRDRKSLHWFNALELVKQGSMSPEEFDRTMADLVNFLTYASEPIKQQRVKLGWWVLLYLLIFAAAVYLLKQIYWKKIK